ncbi:hypothetical protein ABW21_db0207100 [Orbilia brochopaga]|nr:hypothetical protein ABW21_db0207100 [Drechslerella brochopaga]
MFALKYFGGSKAEQKEDIRDVLEQMDDPIDTQEDSSSLTDGQTREQATGAAEARSQADKSDLTDTKSSTTTPRKRRRARKGSKGSVVPPKSAVKHKGPGRPRRDTIPETDDETDIPKAGQDELQILAGSSQPASSHTSTLTRRSKTASKDFESKKLEQLNSGAYLRNYKSVQRERGMTFFDGISRADHTRELQQIRDDAHRETRKLAGEVEQLQEELKEAKAREQAAKQSCLHLEEKFAQAVIEIEAKQPAFKIHTKDPRQGTGGGGIGQYRKQIGELKNEVKSHQLSAQEANEKRVEAEYNYKQANAEIQRLQKKEYEATRKAPVLLDEDVNESIEAIFGQKLRAWSRLCSKGLDKDRVLRCLQAIAEKDNCDTVLCTAAFLAPVPSVLTVLGPATFFEALISSVLVERIFKNPFFLADSLLSHFLTAFREAAEKVNTETSYLWKAKTVEIIESLGQLRTEQIASLGIKDHSNFGQCLTNILNEYMRIFMNENPKLTEEKKRANEAKLGDIVGDCISLALDWHKRNMRLVVLDKTFLNLNEHSRFDRNRYREYCCIHKSKEEDVGGSGKPKIIAVVTPGFARITDFEGQELPEPVIWAKAVLALKQDEDSTTEDEDAVMVDQFLSHVPETPKKPENTEIMQSITSSAKCSSQ